MSGHISIDPATVAKPTHHIVSSLLTLTPYCEHHVPTYHSWMTSAELLTLTASEPLSLEEEYDMRCKWERDHDKLTFIILDNALLSSHANEINATPTSTSTETSTETSTSTSTSTSTCTATSTNVTTSHQAEHPSIKAMVGDVNLFFHDYIDGAELEVMIAVPHARRRGFAALAVTMMMSYAREHYGVTRFVVKVLIQNIPSLRLFLNKLGFYPIEYVEVFDELELETCPASDVDLTDPQVIEQRAIAKQKAEELLKQAHDDEKKDNSAASILAVTETSTKKSTETSTSTSTSSFMMNSHAS